jgi:hypothetical protein
MLRITRHSASAATTLTVSGRIGSKQLADLRRLIEEERTQDIVLDLREVSLVDVEVVRFLIECESGGIRIARCPAYVREWMVRENRPP